MRAIYAFLKTTLVGGFFVVLPMVLMGLVVAETVDMLLVVTEPAADSLPVDTLLGIDAALLGSVLLVAAICFAVGLIVRTRIGTRAVGWFEEFVLGRVPLYTLVRSLSRRLAGTEDTARFAPAMASFGDGVEMIVFITEELKNGDYTVLLPVSPTPTVGFVITVRRDRVRPIDASLPAAVGAVVNWGIGSSEVVSGGQAPVPDSSSP